MEDTKSQFWRNADASMYEPNACAHTPKRALTRAQVFPWVVWSQTSLSLTPHAEPVQSAPEPLCTDLFTHCRWGAQCCLWCCCSWGCSAVPLHPRSSEQGWRDC